MTFVKARTVPSRATWATARFLRSTYPLRRVFTTLGGLQMWNTDERDLKAEGQVDEAAGKTQAAVGQVRRNVGDAIESVAKAVGH